MALPLSHRLPSLPEGPSDSARHSIGSVPQRAVLQCEPDENVCIECNHDQVKIEQHAMGIRARIADLQDGLGDDHQEEENQQGDHASLEDTADESKS